MSKNKSTNPIDRSINEFELGETVETQWTAEENEISAFAGISGDHNPLHMDETYAKTSGFSNRIAHGFLIGAKVSGLIGMKLPGKNCLLLEQKLSYPNPVYMGDRILLRIEVSSIHKELGIIELKATGEKLCNTNESPQKVVRGKLVCKILS